MLKLSLFLSLLSVLFCNCASLVQVLDDELLNLIKMEQYVVVLFSSKYCEACDSYENKLADLEENLDDFTNARVVKVIDSQLTRLYSPSKEPALVFFRHGIPLLYDGPPDSELILHTFKTNKEPAVKELTDDNFEHLTQAATGATTGDWFIMFYTSDCIECQKLQALWEAVGAQLKSRMNVARLNKATTGADTAKRFDVFHVPVFILFRLGKMYRYQSHKYDTASFVSFAKELYKNVKPEKVSIPDGPIEKLIAATYGYFAQISFLHQISLFIVFLLAFSLSLFFAIKPSIFKAKNEPAKKIKNK